MKVVMTVCDYCEMVTMGTDIERKSYIVDIPDERIPIEVKMCAETDRGHRTLSITVLKEDKR